MIEELAEMVRQLAAWKCGPEAGCYVAGTRGCQIADRDCTAHRIAAAEVAARQHLGAKTRQVLLARAV